MLPFDLESTLVRKVIHPLWARRDHPYYGRYSRAFQGSQFFSKPELAELQRVLVRDLLNHAYRHCPFYKDRVDAAKLKPSDFEDIACLQSLPPLTKIDIQRNITAMIADNVPESARYRNQTGGSTGAPVQFYVDKERLDSRMASTVRHDSWAGFQPGDWVAYLWGARLDMQTTATSWDAFRNRFLYRRIELNTSSISEQDWCRFIAEIRRIKPRVMLAYAQSAVLFAKYVKENNLNDITFDTIITTAEVLFAKQRQLLEQTFRGKVFNRYGCRELSVIASECEFHNGMHVNADALLVEVEIDEAISAPSGELFITDMLNRSMPLIRYEIGDLGRWSDVQTCPCGRALPLLADLQGRVTDFLIMPDGRKISGPSLTLVIADVCELQHMQIVQEAGDRITLRVVPGRNWDASVEEVLRKRLSLYLHPVVQVKVERCSELEIAASGKHKFVINKMSADSTAAAQSKS